MDDKQTYELIDTATGKLACDTESDLLDQRDMTETQASDANARLRLDKSTYRWLIKREHDAQD